MPPAPIMRWSNGPLLVSWSDRATVEVVPGQVVNRRPAGGEIDRVNQVHGSGEWFDALVAVLTEESAAPGRLAGLMPAPAGPRSIAITDAAAGVRHE